MKIQLDTTAKTIKVEGLTNLGELTDTLERILPNGDWKTFSIETTTIVNHINPTIVERVYYPRHHYWQPWYCGDNVNSVSGSFNSEPLKLDLKQGIYNLSV